MIKCYLVTSDYDNNDVQPRGGKFIKRRDYIAKVSNEEPSTVMVLDENHNWVPYEMRRSCMRTSIYHIFENRFTVNKVFFARNKKSIASLFPKEGTDSYKYSVALETIYKRIVDYRLYIHMAYGMTADEYKNKFVI